MIFFCKFFFSYLLIHLFSRFFSGPKMNVCLWMFGRLNMARTQHNSLYSQLWTELHRSSFGCIPSVRLRFDVVVVVAAHRPGSSYVFRVDLCWLKWSTCQPAMMLDNFSCVCVAELVEIREYMYLLFKEDRSFKGMTSRTKTIQPQ